MNNCYASFILIVLLFRVEMKSKIEPELFKVLAEEKPRRILDIGAGLGEIALYCAKVGLKVDIIEKRKLSADLAGNSKIKLIEKEIKKWKAGERPVYDLIILRSVIHFFPQIFLSKRLFPQVVKSLKRGGLIYILTMTVPESSGRFTYKPEYLIKVFRPLKLVFKKEIKKVHKLGQFRQEHKTWQLFFKK